MQIYIIKSFILLLILVHLSSVHFVIGQTSVSEVSNNDAFHIPFLKNPENSATYDEVFSFCGAVADKYDIVKFADIGPSDAGPVIPLLIIDQSKKFNPKAAREDGKLIYFINNAIHPGEPCGVDASMMFIQELLSDDSYEDLLQSAVILIIPIYNVGGALNRRPNTRANQVGPSSQGFRGNAKNLDLNRDFIKMDSRNARGFSRVYSDWRPDIFLDTHTSNGADYQYTMTLLPNQHDRVGGPLGKWTYESLTPALYKRMEEKGWEMCPYVNTYGNGSGKPEDGIAGFLDLPRYSSGYASLFHSIGYTSEAHMLKPFEDRVESTHAIIWSLLELGVEKKDEIKAIRSEQEDYYRNLTSAPINWEHDGDQVEMIEFKGYEGAMKPSEITGMDRLYYDRDRPFIKQVPYKPHYKVSNSIEIPKAYVIPRAYEEVVELLELNGVVVEEFSLSAIQSKGGEVEASPAVSEAKAEDPLLGVEERGDVYYIEDFDSRSRAYEGHYLHSNIKVRKVEKTIQILDGDFIVYTDQPNIRFIIETLEPEAPDSYFAWNYFDGILMQKEWYSAYVFEDLAVEILESDPELKARFEEKKATEKEFAEDSGAQLYFIYINSSYYEDTHNLYPIKKIY
jgi:hypothetical protein